MMKLLLGLLVIALTSLACVWVFGDSDESFRGVASDLPALTVGDRTPSVPVEQVNRDLPAVTPREGGEGNGAHSKSRSSSGSNSRTPIEAIGDGPERPEPNQYEGPLIAESFDDGMPYFEAEQVLGEDGTWRLHGRWTSWYENGQMQEQGQYADHLETGEWIWWYENGNRAAHGQFLAGNREGAWTLFHENGVKMADANYLDGDGDGPWILYYEDGSKWAQGNYIDGEIAGYWTIWDEFGEVNPERSGIYEGGKRISP